MQNKDAMKTSLVSHTLNLAALPPLTEGQKAELAALAALAESDIDMSDIPPLPDEVWRTAVRGRFYKPRKVSTTVRLDADVLDWLRSQGRGYQTRLNAILRRQMLAALKER